LRGDVASRDVPMTLLDRVRREARELTWRSRGVHASAAVAVLLLVVALGAWLLTDGRWLAWPRGIPLLVWLVAAAFAALAFRLTGARVPVPSSAEGLALGIEREQGLRAGSLRGALEIGDQGVLGARAVADVESRLGRGEVLLPAARRRATRSLAGGLGAALLALAVTGVVSAKARDGFAAVLHPLDAWRGLLLPALAFEGLPVEMPRGMPLTLRVRAEGRTSVAVSLRTAGEAWRTDTVPVDPATALATVEVGPLRAPLTVRVDDGRAPVLEQDVTVGDRGWIGDVQVSAVYPAYLARPSERLELTGGVRVPRGTELRVQAAVYSGARNVQLRGATGDSTLFAELGASAIEARVTVQGDGQWRWRADGTPGADGAVLPVELPEPLLVQMVADEVPAVEILAPLNDTTVSTTGQVLLSVGANDDHGLASVSLLVQRERADGGKDAPTRVPLATLDTPLWDGGYALALEGRKLEAGDRLVVVAQAVDASPWRQQAQSRRLVLRIPTADEQRQLARSLADSLMARADAIAEAERALQRSTSDASKSRELQGGARDGTAPSPSDGAKGSSMSYESAEKMKAMAQQQRDLGERVEQLKDGAKELEQRLSESGAMDKELAARFNELQKMLRDAMTPEMQQKLSELEQASDRLSGSEVRQSLEQLAEQQRQMREQLEKSAEMLKRAALEGAMETLRDDAKELADAERQLADALRQPPGQQQGQGREQSGSASPQQARDLASRTERLEREVKQLTDRLRQEGAQAGAAKTQEAQPDMEASREAMRDAATELGARLPGQPPEQPQSGGQGQPQPGQQQAGQQGQPQPGQPQAGQQGGRPQPGQQQAGQQGQPQPGQQGGRPQPGQQQAGQQGQPQPGQQGGSPQGGGQQGGSPQNRQGAADRAQQAAESMDRAAEQLAAARESQVDAWKQDLSQQLDQTINETAQLARQQQQLADRAQQDGFPQGVQGEQGALQQGVQQAAERLEEASRGSALLSQRSQRAMAEAQQRVQQATQAAGAAGQPGGSEQAQGAMRDAAQALNQALASLVRDRERVNNANSASGFGEMLEQMKELAQQQGSLNGQMQGLQMMPGGPQGQQAQQQARAIARQQRTVADGLQDVADIDPTGRLEALAREAQQVAQALDRGGLDPSVAARQQQLYRRMLDAGRFMEQEERDDQGPRESRAGDGRGTTRATGVTSGKDGVRFAPPTWNELRSLSAEERRLVYEYFRRLNGTPP
jgi:hypothetical protein